MELFDSATRRRIRTAISERAPQAHCPVCQSTTLSLADGFVTLGLERVPASIAFSQTGLPSIALICNQCGYTLLFNAMALGLDDLVQRTAVAS
jgi:hypothetical protein